MNVALFGGTFDPVHSGHLSAARAAMQSFGLDEIHFVPASFPPHKRNRALTAFIHRYAMVVLACAGVSQFVPSLLESEEQSQGQPNYSILTVRRMEETLSSTDRLYFIIGADAFLDIFQWHEPAALLDSCDFIIVSRPGFPIEEIEKVVPKELRDSVFETRNRESELRNRGSRMRNWDRASVDTRISNSGSLNSVGVQSSIALRRTQLHLLTTVEADISSSTIRRLASEGESLRGLVPDAVADYIQKLHLFQNE